MNVEILLAEREIYRKLVRFARAMDDRQWDLIADLAVADLTANFGIGELNGRDAVIANMRSFLDDCGTTQHILGNVLIYINGDRASSQCYVSDMHLSSDKDSDLSFRTLGDYHDEWQKIEDAWFMTRRVKHNRALMGSIEVLGQS